MRAMNWAVVAVVLSAVAFAEGGTIVVKEATGEAAIVGKDEQGAFRQAKEQAIRSAIEQAAGVRVEAFTETVNNQLVRDQIFANTTGYAKKVEVVSKKKDKGVMTVTVKVDVVTENLDKDLVAAQDLIRSLGKPTLVIAIQEQTVPLSEKIVTSTDTMSTVLTNAFKKDGWEVMDGQAMNKSLKLDPTATLGATEAQTIKDLTRAQYLLYGRSLFRHQDPGALGQRKGDQGYYPVTGEYTLVFAATDGSARQLAKVSGSVSATAATIQHQALLSYDRSTFAVIIAKKDEISSAIRKGILEDLRNRTVNGVSVSVSVTGLDSFTSALQFEASLKAMSGVKDAQHVGFSKGTGTYRVTFLGTPAALAEQVETASFKKKKLAVSEVTANTLEINVGK